MGTIHVSAEKRIGAPAETVYGYLADMSVHPRFLPDAFSDFQIESGGVGAGTVTRFKVTAAAARVTTGWRSPSLSRAGCLWESDTSSSLVTKFTVTPEGESSRVAISTTWDGAGGVGGFFERMFAPRVMRGIYVDELERLDAFAQEQRATS